MPKSLDCPGLSFFVFANKKILWYLNFSAEGSSLPPDRQVLSAENFLRPYSLTDKAAAFEAVDGGSIPSRDTPE